MGYQDGVGHHVGCFAWSLRIIGQEWVDQNAMTICFDPPSRMAKPADFDQFSFLRAVSTKDYTVSSYFVLGGCSTKTTATRCLQPNSLTRLQTHLTRSWQQMKVAIEVHSIVLAR